MSRASAALLAALALTAANAAKPLVIDDAVYVEFAKQALAHPGDPYGFEVYWYRTPEPATRVFYDIRDEIVEVLAIVAKRQAQKWLAAQSTPDQDSGPGEGEG